MKCIHVNEPNLLFRYGQAVPNHKDGLFLYGPHGTTLKSKEITVGVVGTDRGLKIFRNWAIKLGGRISVPPPSKREKQHRLHLSNFPGLEEAFGIVLSPGEFVEKKINDQKLDHATRTINKHEAVRKAVDIYLSEIDYHFKNEERSIDVWFLILPEYVFERCKPFSPRAGLDLEMGNFDRKQRERTDLPLFAGVIDQTDEQIFDDVPDFHRQVKARLLGLNYPSQILRETSLAPEDFLNRAGNPIRRVQEPASIAWNVATGIFYKTQPEPPWKLADVRPGVCYLGLVFKNIPNHPQEHVCCAAQMFLNEGDAVVFRGANGPWKTSDYEYNLKPKEAESLITKVVNTFVDKHQAPPKELFIHGRNKFSRDEWRGFSNAAPKETNIVGVRIQTTGGDNKLFRFGDYPVIRGTAIIVDERNAFLWTTGYTPEIDTYIGPETPNPLFITILKHTGDLPDIENVLKDIMGLTKINYNACNYSDGLPVTIRFANKVGDVLTMGSAKDAEKQPLKFYI